MRKSALLLLLISIFVVISGCINNSNTKPHVIPIHDGDIDLTIWLDEYDFTLIPDDLELHLNLYNNGSEKIEYDDWLDLWIKVFVTFPNGSSKWISPWANITRELNMAYLSPGEDIEWSRRIVYPNVSADFFDPNDFNNDGIYLIQAKSGDLMSNEIKINISQE